MAQVDWGDGPHALECSFWTLLVYEEEFAGADLVADMYPKTGRVPWATAIRALWACLRSADDAIPPFKEWARGVSGVDMPGVVSGVVAVVQDGLFRKGPSGPEQT